MSNTKAKPVTKTPTKRNTWSTKELLILCQEKSIAEKLDDCLTTAGVSSL